MARAMMTKVLMSVVVMLFELALAADHPVGGSGGWDTSTNFASWASGETFNVGDKLVFSFLPDHSVLEVSKDDYDSCSTSNPMSTDALTPVTVTLTAAGSRYFICGTPGHCDQGMKVEIKTVGSASSAPPPTTTTTPPSSASPPTTTTTPSTAPPPTTTTTPSTAPPPTTTTTPSTAPPPTTTIPPSSDSPPPTTTPSSAPPPSTTTTPPSSNSPPPSMESSPSYNDAPTPPVTSNGGPTSSDQPAKPSPSSATTVKISAISMVGIGLLMMI